LSIGTQYKDKKGVIWQDIIRFYGRILLVENTWGNNVRDMRVHLKYLNEHYGKVKGLGINRFCQLIPALDPELSDIETLVLLLNGANNK
jgi:hypothetical protein